MYVHLCYRMPLLTLLDIEFSQNQHWVTHGSESVIIGNQACYILIWLFSVHLYDCRDAKLCPRFVIPQRQRKRLA